MRDLLSQSLRDPRAAAVRLLATDPPLRVGLEGVLAISALGALVVGSLSGGRIEIRGPDGILTLAPLTYAVLVAVGTTVGGLALAWAGRALRGTGEVAGAVAVVAWLQLVNLALTLAATAVALVVPPLAALALVAAIGAFLWCILGFVGGLHGVGPGRALAIVLVAGVGGLVGFAVALGVVLGLLGMEVTTDA